MTRLAHVRVARAGPSRARRLALAIALVCAACVDDRTQGQFELRAADDTEADVHGSVYAKSETEAGGYWITLDLRQQPWMLHSQETLSLVFDEKPDTGSWPAVDRLLAGASGFEAHFAAGACNVATRWDSDSTIASYWHVDSGRVRISSPRDQSGVAGSFRLFASRTDCRAADTLHADIRSRVVMAGSFETHAPARHRARDFVRAIFGEAN